MSALFSFCLCLVGILVCLLISVHILSNHKNIRDIQIKVTIRNGFEIKSRFYKEQ